MLDKQTSGEKIMMNKFDEYGNAEIENIADDYEERQDFFNRVQWEYNDELYETYEEAEEEATLDGIFHDDLPDYIYETCQAEFEEINFGERQIP